MAIPLPLIIAGASALGGLLNRGGQNRQQVQNANALGENNFNMDLFRLLSEMETLQPGNERDRQLDPARNSVLSSLIGEFFPDVDPGVTSALSSAGPRPSFNFPTPPKFQGFKEPSFFGGLLGGGLPQAGLLVSSLLGRGGGSTPGAPAGVPTGLPPGGAAIPPALAQKPLPKLPGAPT